MSINEFSQKANLLSKKGLGVPRMPSNIKVSQSPQPTPQPQQPKPNQPQPIKAPQPTTKPGCGSCRRKRPQ